MKFQGAIKMLKLWVIQTNDPETSHISPGIWGSPRSLQAKYQCCVFNAKGIIEILSIISFIKRSSLQRGLLLSISIESKAIGRPSVYQHSLPRGHLILSSFFKNSHQNWYFWMQVPSSSLHGFKKWSMERNSLFTEKNPVVWGKNPDVSLVSTAWNPIYKLFSVIWSPYLSA